MRRGEVPFVAVPVGYAGDKEILGLAADLKISRALALGYYALLHELMLRRGDVRLGVLKDYKPHELAAQLDYHGNPARLINALKRAGLLSTHRGTFKIPEWLDTPTGMYAAKKAEDRANWAREKAEQRAAARAAVLESQGVDVHPESGWTGGGRPAHVQVDNGQKERKVSAQTTPQPPPKAGESLGASRWEWVLNSPLRSINPRGCIPYLNGMSSDEYACFQWSLLPVERGGPRSSSRRKRYLGSDSYRVLAKQLYLEYWREWREKLDAGPAPKNGAPSPKPKPVDEVAERKAASVAFLTAQLSDATLPPAERKKIRARWVQLHPELPPPPDAPDQPEGLPPPPPTN